MEFPDWSDLPIELWKVVAEKLPLEDHNRFAGVCTAWRSLVQEIRPYKFPWLVLSDLESNRPEPNTHPFFNLLETKLPNTQNSFHLLNPFSGVEIPLPPPSAFPHPQYPGYPHFPRDYYFIRKAVLSSGPATSSQYTVMAIYSDQSWLAFFKSGSDKWIHINTPKLIFQDLMYSNGRFYVHTLEGRVVVCNLEDDDHPRTIEITPLCLSYPISDVDTQRMVVYHGDFCQQKNFPPCSTVRVKVFKIDEKMRGGGREA
ncbi:SWR1-complex protein 3 [Asimina triloba]